MSDATAPSFAGLWRRLGAFVVDALVLGAIGQVLGMALFDTLARLGAGGRLAGFAIAGAYFAGFEGLRGASPGKRLMGLQVARVDGTPPGLGRAALRYAIFGVPYFLNGALLPMAMLVPPWSVVLALAVFGVGGSTLWLLLFDRPARRALHDLATGTLVVRAGAPAAAPLARAHVVVVALLLVAAAVAPVALGGVAGRAPFAQLVAMQGAIAAEAPVRAAAVADTRSVRYGAGGSASERIVSVVAFVDRDPADPRGLPERLADVVFQTYPEATAAQFIVVELARGFDLGIASRVERRAYRYTPQQWRDRIAGGAQG